MPCWTDFSYFVFRANTNIYAFKWRFMGNKLTPRSHWVFMAYLLSPQGTWSDKIGKDYAGTMGFFKIYF